MIAIFDDMTQITEEEIQGYYDPKKNKPFPFYHITEEIPCGFYVA